MSEKELEKKAFELAKLIQFECNLKIEVVPDLARVILSDLLLGYREGRIEMLKNIADYVLSRVKELEREKHDN